MGLFERYKRLTVARQAGSALIECVLTLPLLFAFTVSLISTGMMVWQGQRSATVAREAANIALKQCLRTPGATTDLTNLYQCFDQAVTRITQIQNLGIQPTRNLAYHGHIAGFDASTPVVPVRTVFVMCLNWVAVDVDTGDVCQATSSDCIRRCGDPSIVPPVPPDPSMISVRDSARPAMLVPDSMKLAIWNAYGTLIERRGGVLISEVASGHSAQSFAQAASNDVYETVVF